MHCFPASLSLSHLCGVLAYKATFDKRTDLLCYFEWAVGGNNTMPCLGWPFLASFILGMCSCSYHTLTHVYIRDRLFQQCICDVVNLTLCICLKGSKCAPKHLL